VSTAPDLFVVPGGECRRVARTVLPTRFGLFDCIGYEGPAPPDHAVALVLSCRDPAPLPLPLVRIHSQCLTGDVFGSERCDCGPQFEHAMALVASEGRGAIIYQFQEGRGIGLLNKLRAYELQDRGADTVEANVALGLPEDARSYAFCAKILLDLGLARIRILTNNPFKISELVENGIDVVERVPSLVRTPPSAKRYLDVKKAKMGHLL
jgi:3,4-dihydroxy 2-butanone 4-phosphate synthase/GTP cyclohydrolase II